MPYLGGYHLDDEGLWVPDGAARDLPYTEGEEFEAGLRAHLAAAGDLSVLSPELPALVDSPRTRYHLSPRRANLLRPLEGLLRGRVLEVGAGCGALTRYLGEIGGSVTAVEGSRRRAAIAHLRTADLPNVAVVWDDVARFRDAEGFDAVVLVGVLEYARVFLRAGPGSQELLLRHLAGLLAPDGVLVLAIENQLGARYWAGGAEDHLLTPYFGLQDHYGDATVATFGRHCLRQMLEASGLPHQEWYLPVPDYKLPVSVVSPAGLAVPGRFDAAAMLARHAFWDERRPVHPPFALERVWPVLQRNGLLLDFANSFLVVAGPAPAFRQRLDRDVLAWSWAVERRAGCAKESAVTAAGGQLRIRRRALAPKAPAPDGAFGWRLHDEPYPEGENWWCRLCGVLTHPAWTPDDAVAWARTWLRAVLLAAGADPGAPPDPRRRVDGWLLGATPLQLVAGPEGDLRFTDLEWEARGGVELGFLVWRAMEASLGQIGSVAWMRPGPPPTAAALLQVLLRGLGLDLAPSELERYRRLEEAFQAAVAGVP